MTDPAMAEEETLVDVSDSNLEATVKGFEKDGATVVTKKQLNGKWTVTATYPKQKKPSS